MKPYYYSVNEYLKNEYGKKLYKLALNGGMTCPNRDGLIDTRGCIFCSQGGSGDFTFISDQIEQAKSLIKDKYSGNDYIAYFQAFTNTYASVEYLRDLYLPIVQRDDIKLLSIATRPDCINDDILDLLIELNKIKPVWIELGLQTIHSETASYIRRGYDLSVYDKTMAALSRAGLKTIVHMIVGLPNESLSDMIATAKYIANSNAWGIKLQLLHILKDTDLYKDYLNGYFKAMELDEYIYTIGEIIKHLPKEMVIHRLTGDGPKNILVAPLWSGNKKLVLNSINKYFKDNNIVQGQQYL